MLNPRSVALQGIGFSFRQVAIQGLEANAVAQGLQAPPLFIVNMGRMMGR